MRQDGEMACGLSAGLGDLVGDGFGRTESGKGIDSNECIIVLEHSRPSAKLTLSKVEQVRSMGIVICKAIQALCLCLGCRLPLRQIDSNFKC